MRTAEQRYYQEHKPEFRARFLAMRAKRRAFSDAMKDAPCMDCGGRFPPECMDWDHRSGEVKALSLGVAKFGNLLRWLEETDKCDLVCANCHRIRTRVRRAEAKTD
jgi:hypothetical protein